MRNRTTTWDIIRLAWVLWRQPVEERRCLRIGQMIGAIIQNNQHIYYIENDDLIKRLER